MFPKSIVLSSILQKYNTLLRKAKRGMSMANRIQKKINKMKQDKNMLLYYFKSWDLLCDYESMETFHIRSKIKKTYLPGVHI